MGCDIHFYVEIKKDGAWASADTWVVDDPGTKDERAGVPYESRFYKGRNYDLFAMLADVRNGRGFAGVRTCEGFHPIAEPRGVPADASPEYRGQVDQWGEDGHSHSWLTVADLLAYDWTQQTYKEGVVGFRDLAAWKVRGRPDSWSGLVTGPGIKIFTAEAGVAAVETFGDTHPWWKLIRLPEDPFGRKEPTAEAAPIIAAAKASLGCESPHFQVRWGTAYHEAAASFLSETMPKLWRLGAPDDVRIVFFFDN